jgi:hypothetical protein
VEFLAFSLCFRVLVGDERETAIDAAGADIQFQAVLFARAFQQQRLPGLDARFVLWRDRRRTGGT